VGWWVSVVEEKKITSTMKGRHMAYNLAILMVSSIFPHSQIVYNKATLAKFNAKFLFIQGNTT